MVEKPSLTSVFKKAQDKFSALKSGEGLAIISKAKGTLMRLGVILSFSIFALVLVLWGSLAIYKSVLTGQVNELKKQQSEIFNDNDKEMATKIVDFEKASVSLQSLLKSHLYASNLFDKLAAATVPRVQWKEFDLTVQGNIVNVQGFSANYTTIAKQILALSDAGFLSVNVSNISMEKTGGVGFDVVFNFDPKILQK